MSSSFIFMAAFPPSVPAFSFFEKKEKELHSGRAACDSAVI